MLIFSVAVCVTALGAYVLFANLTAGSISRILLTSVVFMLAANTVIGAADF